MHAGSDLDKVKQTFLTIGSNRECKIFNKFSFSIAKNNIFDCQKRYNGNRKRLVCVQRSSFWQSKTLYLSIVNDLPKIKDCSRLPPIRCVTDHFMFAILNNVEQFHQFNLSNCIASFVVIVRILAFCNLA